MIIQKKINILFLNKDSIQLFKKQSLNNMARSINNSFKKQNFVSYVYFGRKNILDFFLFRIKPMKSIKTEFCLDLN